MTARRASWIVSVCGAMSLVGVVLAAATIWLFATDPLAVARAIDERDVPLLLQAVAQTLGRAVTLLVRWL
jgi:hypothetical protein